MNSLEKTKFESAPCHGEDLLLSAKRNLMRGLLLLLLGTHVEADLRSRGHGAQKAMPTMLFMIWMEKTCKVDVYELN